MSDIQNQSLEERFTYLLEYISSSEFLGMETLNGEIPFYICPFVNSQEFSVIDETQNKLANRLEQTGIKVLQVNLYDLSIELIKERGRFESLIARESQLSKDKLLEFFQNTVDPEQHLVPAIEKKMEQQDFDVMFICGVGEVFPYIRSHVVLNNLQSKAKLHPSILFFPGEYRFSMEFGASLELFGKLQDDKYYRAYNIYNR